MRGLQFWGAVSMLVFLHPEPAVISSLQPLKVSVASTCRLGLSYKGRSLPTGPGNASSLGDGL